MSVHLNNIDNLLEKINLDKSRLNEIFTTKNIKYNNSILYHLTKKNKSDLIYYFFEMFEPKMIIKESEVYSLLSNVIERNNYELFIFLIRHIINLKYESVLYNYIYIQRLGDNTMYNFNIDFRIVNVLVKLGYKISKHSKYYSYFTAMSIKF